jgi:hypothetical protein
MYFNLELPVEPQERIRRLIRTTRKEREGPSEPVEKIRENPPETLNETPHVPLVSSSA